MISAVIPTSDSERALLPTLAALVPGAVSGAIREVIVADAGSRDGTAMVADVAGCRFLEVPGTLGKRLGAAAEIARGPWLMFLRPGAIPDAGWTEEVERFMQRAEGGGREQAAFFRRAVASRQRPLAEAISALFAAMRPSRHAGPALLISKTLYAAIGGHRVDIPDAQTEADLIRRLGRRRIVVLRSAAPMTGA
jgi:glycosyltransferase involved in cell wall biosynthesis